MNKQTNCVITKICLFIIIYLFLHKYYMKINICQILDFLSILLESVLGYYLYKDNKKKLSLKLIRTIKIKAFVYDLILFFSISCISLALPIFLYYNYRKVFVCYVYLLTLSCCYYNYYFCILLIPLYFYGFNSTDDTRVLNTIYRNYKTLLCYTIYNVIGLIFTITSLELVLHINYIGLKRIVFIFMNVIMLFNLSKKISVNVILLIFFNNEKYIEKLFKKIKATGNVCMSSIFKIFTMSYIGPANEDMIVIYSLINDSSYWESLQKLKNYPKNKFQTERFVFYSYIVIMLYIVHKCVICQFYEKYCKLIFFLYLHVFFIEMSQSISIYYKIQDIENENKIIPF